MAADYLVYWPWYLVLREFDLVQFLVHDSSGKFRNQHIEVGDVLWYVTVPRVDGKLTGNLYLNGRLEVGLIIEGNDEAQHYLDTTYHVDYEVRDDVGLHIFAREGTGTYYTLIDIRNLAPALRFVSAEGHDRLTVVDVRVTNTLQLQTMRMLEPASAALLHNVWKAHDHTALVEPDPDFDNQIPLIEPDPLAFPEGRTMLRTHLTRERKPKLVRLAKQRFKDLHGRLYCEVCGFDFSERYGALGDNYIEAHHTIPVSELRPGDVTRIEDLAMVCANCHRMLHRRRPWLRMAELKQLLVATPVSAISR